MTDVAPAVALEEAERAFAKEIKHTIERVPEPEDAEPNEPFLLPTGATAPRVFAVGELAVTTPLAVDEGSWRGRLLDPTGSVFIHVGRLTRTDIHHDRTGESPRYVAVVGSPRIAITARGSANVGLFVDRLDRVTEDRTKEWIIETCDRTLERIERLGEAAADEAAAGGRDCGFDVESFRTSVVEVRDTISGLAERDRRNSVGTGSYTPNA